MSGKESSVITPKIPNTWWSGNEGEIDLSDVIKPTQVPAATTATTNSYVDFLKEQGLTGNTQIDYANSAGLGGLTQGTWNNLGQGAGLAGSMYNMYDSMFGNKADLYKQQIGNLKDQRAYNAQTSANQKQFKSKIGSGCSGAFSNGLAASRVG